MTTTPPPTWHPEQPTQPRKPLWRQKKVIIPGAVLGGLVALGILGAAVGPAPKTQVQNVAATSAVADQIAADKAAADRAAAQAEADRAATEKIAAEAAAAKAAAERAAADKAAADKAAADKAAADKAAADKAAAEAAAPTVDFTMPNLVGVDLQSAQNTVQTNGVFFSISHDLLGARSQVMDANWRVCNQTPAAGTRIAGPAEDWEGRIDFGVVKLTEACR